jgi:serine protease Do
VTFELVSDVGGYRSLFTVRPLSSAATLQPAQSKIVVRRTQGGLDAGQAVTFAVDSNERMGFPGCGSAVPGNDQHMPSRKEIGDGSMLLDADRSSNATTRVPGTGKMIGCARRAVRSATCVPKERIMRSTFLPRAARIASGAALFAIASAANSAVPNNAPLDASVAAPAEGLGKAFAAVAAHIRPAVVSVYSEKVVKLQSPDIPFGDEYFRRFFGGQVPPGANDQPREYRQGGMGSGMILDKLGHILTNYHVVSDVDQIKVQLADRRSFNATVVGTDPKTDVAVIKITGSLPHDLPTVQFGDSDALEVGNLVMAVGAPFGLTQTVTIGIVSAKGRADVGIAAYEDFIQTDAPINPGNSGGPLVNMRGEVIGMNSAIATGGGGQSAGIGFAIPANMIKTMLPTLVAGGRITRGMLGVVIQDLTDDLAAQFHLREAKGALVSQVGRDSPAQKAGLKAGDVVVRYGDNEIRDTRELRNLVAATAPGTRTRVVVVRDGKERTLEVTIGRQPAGEVEAARPPDQAPDRLSKLGLGVQTLTPEIAAQLDLEGERGVIVDDVRPGSAAAAAGLQEGDLIVEANRVPVADVDGLLRALGRVKGGILLLLKRQATTVFVVLRLD